MVHSESNPLHHTQKMKAELTALIAHLRDDVSKVDEPQFKAMFETSAEVLEGSSRPSAVTRRRMKPLGGASASADIFWALHDARLAWHGHSATHKSFIKYKNLS